MTPKKKAKFDEPVIPENADLSLVYDTTAEDKPAVQPRHGLFAYAAFELDGVRYEAGDEFTPPANWTRDTDYDEFRGIQRKGGADLGIAFTVPGEILDRKTGERVYRREVLPLKEA